MNYKYHILKVEKGASRAHINSKLTRDSRSGGTTIEIRLGNARDGRLLGYGETTTTTRRCCRTRIFSYHQSADSSHNNKSQLRVDNDLCPLCSEYFRIC